MTVRLLDGKLLLGPDGKLAASNQCCCTGSCCVPDCIVPCCPVELKVTLECGDPVLVPVIWDPYPNPRCEGTASIPLTACCEPGETCEATVRVKAYCENKVALVKTEENDLHCGMKCKYVYTVTDSSKCDCLGEITLSVDKVEECACDPELGLSDGKPNGTVCESPLQSQQCLDLLGVWYGGTKCADEPCLPCGSPCDEESPCPPGCTCCHGYCQETDCAPGVCCLPDGTCRDDLTQEQCERCLVEGGLEGTFPVYGPCPCDDPEKPILCNEIADIEECDATCSCYGFMAFESGYWFDTSDYCTKNFPSGPTYFGDYPDEYYGCGTWHPNKTCAEVDCSPECCTTCIESFVDQELFDAGCPEGWTQDIEPTCVRTRSNVPQGECGTVFPIPCTPCGLPDEQPCCASYCVDPVPCSGPCKTHICHERVWGTYNVTIESLSPITDPCQPDPVNDTSDGLIAIDWGQLACGGTADGQYCGGGWPNRCGFLPEELEIGSTATFSQYYDRWRLVSSCDECQDGSGAFCTPGLQLLGCYAWDDLDSSLKTFFCTCDVPDMCCNDFP